MADKNSNILSKWLEKTNIQDTKKDSIYRIENNHAPASSSQKRLYFLQKNYP